MDAYVSVLYAAGASGVIEAVAKVEVRGIAENRGRSEIAGRILGRI